RLFHTEVDVMTDELAPLHHHKGGYLIVDLLVLCQTERYNPWIREMTCSHPSRALFNHSRIFWGRKSGVGRFGHAPGRMLQIVALTIRCPIARVCLVTALRGVRYIGNII